ncbi:hypothetical protein [Ferrimonas marina]|uniref:Uncharacterized protein n=1 Tax=Ferrimonas marina TaxID=299255 RepID=A0A1M5U9K4_9GAMM|nr:hypothetical protein [Ferrimonas marina]SHH59735.1 hypothetical protein SAMN02745129_2469 [Ferrimonas marina]
MLFSAAFLILILGLSGYWVGQMMPYVRVRLSGSVGSHTLYMSIGMGFVLAVGVFIGRTLIVIIQSATGISGRIMTWLLDISGVTYKLPEDGFNLVVLEVAVSMLLIVPAIYFCRKTDWCKRLLCIGVTNVAGDSGGVTGLKAWDAPKDLDSEMLFQAMVEYDGSPEFTQGLELSKIESKFLELRLKSGRILFAAPASIPIGPFNDLRFRVFYEMREDEKGVPYGIVEYKDNLKAVEEYREVGSKLYLLEFCGPRPQADYEPGSSYLHFLAQVGPYMLALEKFWESGVTVAVREIESLGTVEQQVFQDRIALGDEAANPPAEPGQLHLGAPG